MLLSRILFAALTTVEFGALLPGAPHRAQEYACQQSEEIVVTGIRLQATQVDYRMRGARVAYCGARDERQDTKSVAAICGFLEDCALGGARSRSALSKCVETMILALDRRRN